MARNQKLADCRHLDVVEHLKTLPADFATRESPIVRKYESGVIAYWREGDRVVWHEMALDEVPAFLGQQETSSDAVDLLVSDVRSRFDGLLPQLLQEVSELDADMDSIERALRDSCLSSGLVGLKAMLEKVDKGLEAPMCEACGKRYVRHRRSGKTFMTRLGPVHVERTYFRCPSCGNGVYLLDRKIGAEGDSFTAGGASMIARAVSEKSFAAAADMIEEMTGVRPAESTLQRRATAIGRLAERFESEVGDGEAVSADRAYLSIDGTGVPMRPSEVAGVKGKQLDGSARTAEAKIAAVYTALGLDAQTGEPKKDAGSTMVSVAIDSAAAIGGVSSRSDFAKRLVRLLDQTGLRDGKEVVVISDGAPWIRNVCEELLSEQRVTYVLDFWHALEYAGAALRALKFTDAECAQCRADIRDLLKDGRVHDVIAWLEPYRAQDQAVATCIDYYKRNQDRMRYDEYIKRGIQIGSGVIESLGRQIVGERLKKAGSHWSKAGANRILAIKSCLYNNRWSDFLKWKRNLAIAA